MSVRPRHSVEQGNLLALNSIVLKMYLSRLSRWNENDETKKNLFKDLHWLLILLFLTGKMGITASFTIVYVHTAEMLPTVSVTHLNAWEAQTLNLKFLNLDYSKWWRWDYVNCSKSRGKVFFIDARWQFSVLIYSSLNVF